ASRDRRIYAVVNLALIGRKHPKVLPALLALAKTEKDKEGVKVLIDSLARFNDAKSAPKVVPVIKSYLSKKEYRVAAADALGELGKEAKSAIPDLVKAAKQANAGPYNRESSRFVSSVVGVVARIDARAGKKLLDALDQQRREERKKWIERERQRRGPNKED